MTFKTRFAPSPTGPLHLGHAFAALFANDLAQANNGEFLIRIEDIDRARSKLAWEEQIYEDLEWLGLTWSTPVMRQSERMPRYQSVLDQLWDQGLLYACTCNRRDIKEAASAPQEGGAPVMGPDGIVYPGTCRTLNHDRTAGALRLNMQAALARLANKPLSFHEMGQGPNGQTGDIQISPEIMHTQVGDIVLARRDMGTSYHLSVVLDDADQEITHVTRGLDLFEATSIHILLQRLTGLTSPKYYHHKLIRDNEGKRLAKRDDARAISLFRAEGMTPQMLRKRVGLGR